MRGGVVRIRVIAAIWLFALAPGFVSAVHIALTRHSWLAWISICLYLAGAAVFAVACLDRRT
ncbi:MAG TPA: hypothetical protein VH008_27135 [Pseudonocardia sp.]|jgi:hypothetical protein|nr:hypothetical protein [Pseudonocardia sp.]